MYAAATQAITRGILGARRRLTDTVRDERGDVPGWVLIAIHLRHHAQTHRSKNRLRASLLASPPKVHLSRKDAPSPQSGGGGSPFEPGRVRGTHGTAGAVGVPISRVRDAVRDLHKDEVGDVPGWVLITLMTAGLVVLIWALAGPALGQLFEQAIARVSGI